MGDIAIRTRNIGKQYHIGGPKKKYPTFRAQISDAVAAPFRRTAKLLKGQATGAAELDELIWALEDISFDVKHGEVVGIIGRNGAGKSTLLKIISRITEPTTGYIDLYGRVGSLLEVGTGFHLELTGRENIYLNGSILGMKRVEIDRKFDEIVDFSEVEKFIDTPVKHYSSGMLVRLAFSVAAHLDPEILIVDEVLAVGDTRFQKKCMNKMGDVGQQGRTVLFVSHNMAAITRLCERVILLDEGKLLDDGAPHNVVSSYMNADQGTSAQREWPDPAKAPSGDAVRLCAARIRTEDGQISDAIDIRYPVILEMEYEVLKPGYVLLPHYHLFNEQGIYVFTTFDQDSTWRNRPRPVGCYVSQAVIPGNFLSEGTLFVHANMSTLDPHIFQFSGADAVAFQVIDSMDGDSARGDWGGSLGGAVRPLLKWNTQTVSNGQESPEMVTEQAKS